MISWNWDFALEILPRLGVATLNTLAAAGIGYAIALVIGLAFTLCQRNDSAAASFATREIVEFIRSTPLVLQIYFVFYVGPQFGITLAPWTAGMIAIGLHYAAYLSEVYRAGLDSVPKGQWEACKALNFGRIRTYFKIIIPQALPASLPGMGNYLVSILKDTPVLSVIGVAELMHTASSVGTETYRYLEPYTLVGCIFLAITLPAAFGLRKLEAWSRRSAGISA